MEVNSQKTKLIRELGEVDISSLKNRILELGKPAWNRKEDYEMNYNKHPKGALHQTDHIILRFSNKRNIPFQYRNSTRWSSWADIVEPIINKVVLPYGYTNGFCPRVMLAKLPAKAFIAPHIDGDENGYIPHKIHIPILTNESAYFFLGQQRFHFQEGYAYEVNNGMQHGVANNGSTDRIHLIFEYLNIDEQPDSIRQQIDHCRKAEPS